MTSFETIRMPSRMPRMMLLGLCLFAICSSRATIAEPKQKRSPELLPPQQVFADGKPIDVEREGHAAPFFGDIDGDGVRDLLVGQYADGKLRVYRNVGTDQAPVFKEFHYLRAGEKDASIPFD